MSPAIAKILDVMLKEGSTSRMHEVDENHPLWTLPEEARLQIYQAVDILLSLRGRH